MCFRVVSTRTSYARDHLCMTDFEGGVGELQKASVEAFFVADHADVVGGKVYVNGGFWSRLQFPSYPAAVPPIAIVAALHVPARMYQAEHIFTVSLEDPDGHEVPGFKAEGRFRVGASPDMELGEPTTFPVVLPVVGLTIQRPGTYIFVLRLNKVELARLKIHAAQVAIVQQLGFMPLASPPTDDDA